MKTSTDNADPFENLDLLGTGAGFFSELCDMLSQCQLLKDLEWEEIKQVARYIQAYGAKDGVTLFHEGDIGNYLCFLLSGQVEIHKSDKHAHDKVVAQVSAGKTLGEMAMIDSEPRSATCVAKGPVQLAILFKANFDRMVVEHPLLAYKITHRIARLLSQRLRLTSGQLVDYLSSN